MRGCPPFRLPRSEEVGGGAAALSLARFGACADELRLVGVERDEVPTGAGRAEGNKGFLSRTSSRTCGPPATERMWRGPWEDGAICTMQLVESGGRLRDRRCSLVGRLVAAKRSRS